MTDNKYALMFACMFIVVISFFAGYMLGQESTVRLISGIIEGSEFTIDINETKMATAMIRIYCDYGTANSIFCELPIKYGGLD